MDLVKPADKGRGDILYILFPAFLVGGQCHLGDDPFKTACIGADTRNQPKFWIICNELSRRNLTPQQMSYLRGLRYNLEKKENGKHGLRELDPFDQAKSTAEKLAKECGVSDSTIRRVQGGYTTNLDWPSRPVPDFYWGCLLKDFT